MDADDSYSVSVKVGSSSPVVLKETVDAGDSLSDVQSALTAQISSHSDLDGKVGAYAVSEIDLPLSFAKGTVFSVTFSPSGASAVTVSFTATEASSADYTVADVRAGIIENINLSDDASVLVTAERGLGAGSVSIALNANEDGNLTATNIAWGSVDVDGGAVQASTAADINIRLEALDDGITFAASASAVSDSGDANTAYTFDTDTFSFATADSEGSLTAKMATVTIVNNGGSLSVNDKMIVTDPDNETALAETVAINTVTAIGVDQLVASSAQADAGLVVATNELLQAKSNLAGLLMSEATAKSFGGACC